MWGLGNISDPAGGREKGMKLARAGLNSPTTLALGNFICHRTHMISYPGSYLATRMKSQPFYNALLPNSYTSTELLYRFISVLNTFGRDAGARVAA